jgi:hypothetical protein
MAEDLPFHADGGVHQQRRAGGPETPIDRCEFVDDVTRLLSEEASEIDLMPAEEMETHARRTLGHAEGVIDLRNADQEVRWVDAALCDEAG